MIGWWRLQRELDRWAVAGRRPRLWWRDDDAADATPSLSWLLELAERFQVPLLLAVVPGSDTAGGLVRLAQLIQGKPLVFVCQHGVAHVDRGRSGEPSAEFPAWEAPAAIAAAIAAVRPRITALPNCLPVFVPPWNAASPALQVALRHLRLALSAGGDAGAGPAHAEFDLMRWKLAPRFRGRERCCSRLARLLRIRRTAGDWARPVGVLTHHLVADAATWQFLEEFLDWTRFQARVEWLSPADIFHEHGSTFHEHGSPWPPSASVASGGPPSTGKSAALAPSAAQSRPAPPDHDPFRPSGACVTALCCTGRQGGRHRQLGTRLAV